MSLSRADAEDHWTGVQNIDELLAGARSRAELIAVTSSTKMINWWQINLVLWASF